MLRIQPAKPTKWETWRSSVKFQALPGHYSGFVGCAMDWCAPQLAALTHCLLVKARLSVAVVPMHFRFPMTWLPIHDKNVAQHTRLLDRGKAYLLKKVKNFRQLFETFIKVKLQAIDILRGHINPMSEMSMTRDRVWSCLDPISFLIESHTRNLNTILLL